jgi:hypothetical protein
MGDRSCEQCTQWEDGCEQCTQWEDGCEHSVLNGRTAVNCVLNGRTAVNSVLLQWAVNAVLNKNKYPYFTRHDILIIIFQNLYLLSCEF